MGNQPSSQNEGGNVKPAVRQIIVNYDKHDSDNVLYHKESYDGFTSPNSNHNESNNSLTELSTELTDTKQDTKEQLVPTYFEWSEDGQNIYLTGSFCNWSQKFLMINLNNKHELSLVLLIL